MPEVKSKEDQKAKTKSQLYYTQDISDNKLCKEKDYSWGKKVRLIERDPTVKLMLAAAIAPAVLTPWSVEADKGVPKNIIDWVQDKYKHHRSHLISHGLRGCIRWGWQGFEKVRALDDKGYSYVRKFKPLLQDITEIAVQSTGSFDGFVQSSSDYIHGFLTHGEKSSGVNDIKVEANNSLLYNFDVVGTYHYGESPLFSAEAAYDSKQLVNKAAERYDQKVAGAQWVVHYPIGTSRIGEEDRDNFDIAMDILASLESSGRMAIPRQLSGQITALNSQTGKAPVDSWEIELITAYGSQVPFNERMMYLDNLLVRVFGFPERSILQGQFGTKAEAGEHGTFAIVNIHWRHTGLVEQTNRYCVNQDMRLNFDEKYQNKVRLSPAPLDDNQQLMLREIYKSIISNPQGFITEIGNIDMTALRNKLDIPVAKEMKTLDIKETGLQPTPQPKEGEDDLGLDNPENIKEIVASMHDQLIKAGLITEAG